MNQVVCIMGPTASGKTALALSIANRLPVEIISVDSAQVYHDLNIGSSKPTLQELTQVPHHLIDVCLPTEPYSAAQFQHDASRLINEIQSRNCYPLLVGGTMMYFRALQGGLHQLPSADPAIRRELESQAEQQGWTAMHQQLTQVDPTSAARISPNDKQRIQRALEVFYASHIPLSEHLKSPKTQSSSHAFVNIALLPLSQPRAQLHQRINQRFDEMLNMGLVDEVIQLRKKYPLHPDLPSMRSVGYRQVWDYLEGKTNYDQMVEKAKTATRQLAKRQMTWLRHWSHVNAIDLFSPAPLLEALRYIH